MDRTIISPDVRQARFQYICMMVAQMFKSLSVEDVKKSAYHTTLCYLTEFNNSDPTAIWKTGAAQSSLKNQIVLAKDDVFVLTGIGMGTRRISDGLESAEPFTFAPDKRYHNGVVTTGSIAEWACLEAYYGGRIRMEQQGGDAILIKEHPAYRLRYDGTSQYAPSSASPALNEQHGEYDFDKVIDRLYKNPVLFGDKDYTIQNRFAENSAYGNIRGAVDSAGTARANNGRLIGGFFLDGFVIPGLATAQLAVK